MFLEGIQGGNDYISQAGGLGLVCNNGDKFWEKTCQDFEGCAGVDPTWMSLCTAENAAPVKSITLSFSMFIVLLSVFTVYCN